MIVATIVPYGPGGRFDCYICAAGAYQCSNNAFGNWDDGERSFTDPLNVSADEIKVEVIGANCFEGGPIEVSLNGNVLGELSSLSSSCTCTDCFSSSGTFKFVSAWYNVGGSNTIKVRAKNSGTTLCVNRVELDLYAAVSDKLCNFFTLIKNKCSSLKKFSLFHSS